jgi:hypothetical protein
MSLSALLSAPAADAQSIPGLVHAEELLSDVAVQKAFYEQLKSRFRNGNFDEILFQDNPNARGPRLSYDAYQKMLATLRSFLQLHPSEIARLQEIPSFAPWRIEPGGQVHELSPELERSWKKIGGLLQTLQEKTASELPAKELILAYARARDPALLTRLADLLIVTAAGAGRIHKLAAGVLPGYVQFLVFEGILREAIALGKSWSVPGRVLDALAEGSSLQGKFPLSNFFRKGTVVVPMSRFEALFKGIGPGECVRTACNRYFDALFPDAFHLKILKNGQETGYFGIYRTVAKADAYRFWFLETIQSPLLNEVETAPLILRGMIRHLQQLAIRENSFLGIPSQTFNSYNFKAVVAELQGLSSTHTGQFFGTTLAHPGTLKQYADFKSSDLSTVDQLITRNSGYEGTAMTNGWEFNQGQVTLVDPLLDQPDWVLLRYRAIANRLEPGSVDAAIKLTLLERAQLILKLMQTASAKKSLLGLQRRLLESGARQEALELLRLIYQNIPLELVMQGFEAQLRHLQYRIAHVPQSNAVSQAFKDELYLSARTWQEYWKILSLGDVGEGKELGRFILTTLDEFADQATSQQLLAAYSRFLWTMPDDGSDLEFTRKVGRRLKTAQDFVALVSFARGEGIERGAFANKNMRDRYVVENWERFLPGDFAEQLVYANAILNRVGNRADLEVRASLFQRSRRFQEMVSIMGLSRTDVFDPLEQAVLSKTLSDSMIDCLSRLAPSDWVSEKEAALNLYRHLLPADQERFQQPWAEGQIALLRGSRTFSEMLANLKASQLVPGPVPVLNPRLSAGLAQAMIEKVEGIHLYTALRVQEDVVALRKLLQPADRAAFEAAFQAQVQHPGDQEILKMIGLLPESDCNAPLRVQ